MASLENIAPSAGGSAANTGSIGIPTDKAGEPTNTDEAANYVVQNTGTVVLTRDQPQNNGNVKATGVQHLSLGINNGFDPGTRSGTDGVVTNAPSF